MRRLGIGLVAAFVMCFAAPMPLACAQEFRLSQPHSVGRAPPEGALAAAEAFHETPSALATEAIPLAPPRERGGREIGAPVRAPGGSSAMVTVGGSLAVVLGLFFLVAWLMRRSLPASMSRLPSEAVEQLGRVPFVGKQNLHLLRVGGKLLLVAVTPFGAETLTEITDPDEVDRLTALCKPGSGHGPSAEFRAVLKQFEHEPAGPGFLGDSHRSDVELASGARRRGGYDA